MKIKSLITFILVLALCVGVVGVIAGVSEGFQNWDVFDTVKSSYSGGPSSSSGSGGLEPSTRALIEVGDSPSSLYFNTAVTPDLSSLAYTDSSCILISVQNGEHVTLNALYTDGVYVLIVDESSVVYSSAVSADFGVTTAGWQSCVSTGSINLVATLPFTAVNYQSIWSSFVSKEAFD